MIRLQQTADGWVVEVTDEHEVAVVGGPEPDFDETMRVATERLRDKRNVAAGMVRAVLTEKAVADAVAKERARCLGWVHYGFRYPYSSIEVRDAVRDGTEAPDGKAV